MEKSWWHYLRRNKKIIFIALIFLIILITLFSTKIALFFNFLLGNDIAVKLQASPEYFALVHGQNATLAVDASVTTNPFCKATCTAGFDDMSAADPIDVLNFTLRPSDPFERDYTIAAPRQGEGMKVYRFSMECKSQETILCHTSGEPTTRSVLITADYTFTNEEKELQQNLAVQLQDMAERIAVVEEKKSIYNLVLQQMQAPPILIANLSLQLQEVQQLWLQQDLVSLTQYTADLNDKLMQAEQKVELANVSLLMERYNALVDDIHQARELLELLSTHDAVNETIRAAVNSTAYEFNVLIPQLASLSFEQKENSTRSFVENLRNLASIAGEGQRSTVLSKELSLDIRYDVLCDLTGTCYNHPPLAQRANQILFNLTQACEESILLQDRIRDLNSSLVDEYNAQGYPVDDAFASNISAYLFNFEQQKKSQYRQNIPLNATNSVLLQKLLADKPLRAVQEYSYNLTPVLVAAFTSMLSCTAFPISIPELASVNLTPITLPPITAPAAAIELIDPPPQCCLFGECRACCISEECRTDPSTYPVVFIHGHAISKDTSFEYSLEGFNKMQKKLEQERYLSAGSITLYTARDTPEGVWGKLPLPVSIRASYYFDLFEQPENYVVVQTKSENIDTYAVRLKEVIDTIKYKTGKPKVKVVAFSMGSLVSRRYIQVFGSDSVDTLILIGAPNKGIVGDAAEYCALTGEQRECADMQEGSLFMNKLNRGPVPSIPIYNIIGTGCDMDGKQGDGTVLEENAHLEGAQNFVVHGRCEGISMPLHLTLRDIDKYPQVYEIVKEALEE